LGDVNKDGLDDFAFGAYKDNEGGTQTGQVFVFFGRNATQWPSTPTTVYASDYANATFIGESINDNAGFSVSGAGDINGDGHDDILIGAANGNANVKGKAYVIFGPANRWVMDQSLSLANLTFTGDYPYDLTGSNSFFAFDVSGLGDINDDGYADFSISAPFVDNRKGIIFVIFGDTTWIPSSPMDTTPTSTPTSAPTPAWPPIILILSLIVVFTFRKRMK
ncbi:MAG: integrin alpha, partial [Candidatus Hodarchaeota archaeon]